MWGEKLRRGAGLAASATKWGVWGLDLIAWTSQVSHQMETAQEGHDTGRGTFIEWATGDLGDTY